MARSLIRLTLEILLGRSILSLHMWILYFLFKLSNKNNVVFLWSAVHLRPRHVETAEMTSIISLFLLRDAAGTW